MGVHGIFLFIVAFIEIILGLFILKRYRKNAISVSFFIIVIGVVIWVLVNAALAVATQEITTDFYYRLAYFAGIIIAANFLYFSWVFPYILFPMTWVRKALVVLPILIFLVLFSVTDLLSVDVIKIDNNVKITYGTLFPLYILCFAGYFVWAFYSLIKKYRTADGIHIWQLKWVIISVIIPFVINLVSDVMLPWFGFQRQFWMVYVGAESSVIWVALTAYILFKKNIKHI